MSEGYIGPKTEASEKGFELGGRNSNALTVLKK